MKRFLIPLLAFFAFPIAVYPGVPDSKDTWRVVDEYYQVNVQDAEIKNGKIYIGMARTQGPNEVTAKMYVKTWNGKVKVDCEKFKYTITAKLPGALLSKSSTYKITKTSLGYNLADNFCYLTGAEGFTPNENPPEWVNEVVKQIKSKPIKKIVKRGSIQINCDSPVWKNKPRCN